MTAALVPIRPSLYDLLPLVADAVTADNSKRAYTRAIAAFLSWRTVQPFTRATVMQYRAYLLATGKGSASVNLALSAVRKLASEAAENGYMDPQTAQAIANVPGVVARGVRAGNWLTRDQARELLAKPDDSLMGLRDRVLLELLLGCGLRRDEAARLTVEQVQQRDGRTVIVDLMGKGRRVRTVPVPAWCAADIAKWLAAASVTAGPLLRAFDKWGGLAGPMTGSGVWWVVRKYAAEIAPHDLRRTCARLCREKGDLEQVQMLLGHSSVQTTERYVSARQNLVNAVNDSIL